MAAGDGGGQVVKVKRAKLEACMTCPLCNKLLKEATTISLCLHTFCRTCIYEKLSDEEGDCCPVCEIDLGILPVEKLRPDHNLHDIIDKIFPVKGKKVDAPEANKPEANDPDVMPSSLPVKRKERSLSSLVVSAPKVPVQSGMTGKRSRALSRKGAALRGCSFSAEEPAKKDDSTEDHPVSSNSTGNLVEFARNKSQDLLEHSYERNPNKDMNNDVEITEGKADLWTPLNCLVEAANRTKSSKPNSQGLHATSDPINSLDNELYMSQNKAEGESPNALDCIRNAYTPRTKKKEANQNARGKNNSNGAGKTIASLDPNSLENRYIVNANQGQTPSYTFSTTGSEASSWNLHRTDNSSTDNGVHSHSNYQYDQHPQPPGSTTSNLGTVNAPQDYNSYASYQNSADPYGYGSAGYPGYYNNYQQQSNPSYSQPVGAYQNTGAPYQPISSFQNTGSNAGSASYSSTYYNPADYQTAGGYPSSSYNNQTNAWSGGNYANYTPHQYSQYTPDTTAAYSSSAASSTSQNYEQHYKQWADYYSQTEVSCAPGTENISVTSTPNVGCPVPGATTGYQTSDSQLPPPPPLPSYAPSWKPEPSPSELSSVQSGAVGFGAHDGYWNHGAPTSQSQVHHNSSMQPHFQKPLDEKTSYDSFQDHQKTAFSQALNMQYPASQQVPHASHTYQSPSQPVTSHASHTYQSPSQPLPSHAYQSPSQPVPYGSHTYQSPLQPVPSHASHTYESPSQPAPPVGTQRVNKLQIPTNPRITSNPTFGPPKTDKDSCTTTAAAKPAYISVSLPKPVDKVTSSATADSLLKPGMFPKSLRGYVERALARCKDDTQMAACQSVMKEIITKATADGTLYTQDWDTEPLFPLPNEDAVKKDSLHSSNLVSSLPKYKRSPNRRSKSRWEPLPEEKPVEKPASVNNDSLKFSWMNVNDKQRKPWMGSAGFKDGNTSNGKFNSQEQKNGSKITQKPFKKQRLSYVSTVENGDASSDSDKEQSSSAYYTGAMDLADSPEERKRRENRSRRFERVQGHRAQNNHFKPKKAGGGNLYARRANALVLSKNFEDGGSRAVEDIDWDSLTVKGTCQEIEKRYLRLTSAPDPATVRPEDVLEKALLMVQDSQKNYLYKCDQLKSIRQDLTVQRIRNHLTVKVYETHARLAVEVGDLPEYNQCASQLKSLYAEGIEGCHMEFSAYNLLCVILHSNNNRDLVSSMASLSVEAKRDEAVKHALAVRSAVTSGNYVMFFRLYKTAPNLSTCLMDLYVEKMRYKAVSCMCRSYRPTIPVPYVAQILGFSTITPTSEESEEKDSEGLDECIEWLKVHGACLVVDNNGELQLDTKPTSSSLYMPETDAVSHGDATLAVNDFLTRTTL